jgi:uncharacterized RDD family membrane protein YckC
MSWHYIIEGKISEALSDEAFAELRPKLDPGTLVWREGMKEWQRLETVPAHAGPKGAKRRQHLSAGRRKLAPLPPQVAPLPQAGTSLAGFAIRAGAFLVDWALLAFVLGRFFSEDAGTSWSGNGFQYWNWNWSSSSMPDWQSWLQPSLSGLSFFVLKLAYEVLMTAEFEATLGKMVFGLRVQHDGERLSYGRSLARALAKKLSAYILCLGYLMVIWDPEKRGLHDLICKTKVLKA